MFQAYRNKLHGRVRVRWYVIGLCVVAANEFGPDFVVPSTTAYFVDFGDEKSDAGWLSKV